MAAIWNADFKGDQGGSDLISIDVTPAIVNKTAIYRIIRDVLEQLGDKFKRKLVLGREFGAEESFNQAMPRKVRWAIRFSRLFICVRPLIKFILPAPSEEVLFFDPLYLLFYGHKVRGKCFVLDLTPLSFPQWHGEQIARLYRCAFRELSQNQMSILAISESTKKDLLDLLNIAPGRVKVLYLYADPSFEQRTQDSTSKEVLFVGSFEPRKNLMGLIDGFLGSNLPKMGFVLSIVGAKTAHFEDNENKILNSPSIKFWNYLSDDELKKRYQNAYIFAYPTFWEGFGIPLLEAMQMGIPCVASQVSACPEVGGKELFYVDPKNKKSIAEGLERLAELKGKSRERYIAMQIKQASQFSMGKFLNELKQQIED